MSCQFRFVTDRDPRAVALRLFIDTEGTPRGEIVGPLPIDPSKPVHPDHCVVGQKTALMAAIRIANANDAEIVVLGDASLWNPAWGTLVEG